MGFRYVATRIPTVNGPSRLLIANSARYGFTFQLGTASEVTIWPAEITAVDQGFVIPINTRPQFLHKDIGPVVGYDWYIWTAIFFPTTVNLIEFIYD